MSWVCCHPERSEGSQLWFELLDPSVACSLRMTVQASFSDLLENENEDSPPLIEFHYPL